MVVRTKHPRITTMNRGSHHFWGVYHWVYYHLWTNPLVPADQDAFNPDFAAFETAPPSAVPIRGDERTGSFQGTGAPEPRKNMLGLLEDLELRNLMKPDETCSLGPSWAAFPDVAGSPSASVLRSGRDR